METKSTKNNAILMTSILTISFFLVLTATVQAQAPIEYKPLVGLPGVQGMSGSTSLTEYINAIYLLTITLGALFGVIKIAFAGVKYSLSDIVTDKASAKKDIQGVLLGLAILLIPFIVLQQIYPGLTNLEVLRSAPPLNLPTRSASSASSLPGKGINATPQPRIETCSYTPISGGDPQMPYVEGYDDTACKNACASRGGQFVSLNSTQSTCSYTPTEEVAPNLSDNPMP